MKTLSWKRIRRAFGINHYSSTEFQRMSNEDAVTIMALVSCAVTLALIGLAMWIFLIRWLGSALYDK